MSRSELKAQLLRQAASDYKSLYPPLGQIKIQQHSPKNLTRLCINPRNRHTTTIGAQAVLAEAWDYYGSVDAKNTLVAEVEIGE